MRIIIEDKAARRAERLALNEQRRENKCERKRARRAKEASRRFFSFA